MPRRSAMGSLAVPMFMPRYNCIASALTTSAVCPARSRFSARSSAKSDFPVPVAPTIAMRLPVTQAPLSLPCPHHALNRLCMPSVVSELSSLPASCAKTAGPLHICNKGKGVARIVRLGSQGWEPECPPPRRRGIRAPIAWGAGAGSATRRHEHRAGYPTAFRACTIPRVTRAGAPKLQWCAGRVIRDEVKGRSLCGQHRHNPPGPRSTGAGRQAEVHESVVFGTPTQALSFCVFFPFTVSNEHVHSAANNFLVFFPRDIVLQRNETFVPSLHDRFGDLVGHRRGRGSGADRVLERKGRGKPGFFDHAQGLLEIFFGLTGETDDNVRRNRRVRDTLAHTIKDAEKPLCAIGATHCLEDPV